MTPNRYIKLDPVSLKGHPELDERWVQDRIREDPSILGLGELVVRDHERSQPSGGRLDLLLQDLESDRRYEVELQLGKTDESHIIRTIEYWDIERKRYPQYDHCAVIVAEDITSRFLNVINLFGGAIPLIAIQMKALRLDGGITLVFTTVLSEMPRGLVDEDEDVREVTNRAYWELRAPRQTLSMADHILGWIKEFDPTVEMNYNKRHIGLSRDGVSNNFVYFKPQQKALQLVVRLDKSSEVDRQIADAGLETLNYNNRLRQYRIRLGSDDLAQSEECLKSLIRAAYDERVA